MRINLIIGWLLVLANAAVGAHALLMQSSGGAGTTPPSTGDTLYTDVPIGSWAYSAIRSLLAHGILVGYPKGYFAGQKVLNRYEFSVAINRCARMILPTESTDVTSQETSGPGGSAVPADDLKTLRRLFLEFRPQLVLLGLDWKTADTGLHTLQDKRLHAEVAEAIAKFAPKPEDNSAGSDMVKRPNWVYDSLQALSLTKTVSPITERQTLTRNEFSVIVHDGATVLYGVDLPGGYGSLVDESPPVFTLADVIELHKLVRAFRRELVLHNVDLKAVEDRLSKAEEKRIQAEEIIDTKPQALK
jgi:hypothetical protein